MRCDTSKGTLQRSGQVNSSSEDRVPGTARPDRGLDTAHLVPAEASRAGAQVLPRICRSASSDRTSVLGLERVDDRFVKCHRMALCSRGGQVFLVELGR